MIFNNNDRYTYASAQLREVICQLRFPTILNIEAAEPAAFQEAVRAQFPRYSVVKEQQPPQLMNAGTPQQKLEAQNPVTNYTFVTQDGGWKLNLTKGFIALSTIHYTRWEEFAQQLDRPLAEFIRIYSPAFFERIGLRYVNIFSRKQLNLDSSPWSDLFQPAYLGLLGEADVDEKATTKSSLDTEMNFLDNSHLKLHAGPGMVKQNNLQDPEVKFILDIDCSEAGNISASQVPLKLSNLHDHAVRTFRGAITDELHNAMGATPID